MEISKYTSGGEMKTRPISSIDLNYTEDELVLRGPQSKYSKFRLSKQLEAQKTQGPERSHFSHGHPLISYLVQLPNKGDEVGCSGSQLELPGQVYGCTKCGFFLHKSCFELPQQISHRSHPHHALNLLFSSPYQGIGKGTFSCNGCGIHGTAFDFNCATCKYDLHVDCAYLPNTLDCYGHAHNLTLYYTTPLDLKNLDIETCDICRMPIASNLWGYYCVDCDYAAHLECAKSNERKESKPLNLGTKTEPTQSSSENYLEWDHFSRFDGIMRD